MDRRIYEFVDGWAAYFQTKRGWNLARGKVWAAFACLMLSLVFANSVSSGRVFFLLLNGFWWGIILYGNILIFRDEADYAESVRKCEKLNAKVQYVRDSRKTGRRIWLCLFSFITAVDVVHYAIHPEHSEIIVDAIWIVWAMAITLDAYLDCCFYLGPGHHSRELNRKEVTNAASERSGV
jgi:hypothetical protein